MNDSCPLCSSFNSALFSVVQDVEYFTSCEFYEYRECLACGCIFLKNPPVEKIQQIYPDTYYSFSRLTGVKALILKPVLFVKSMLDRRFFKAALRNIAKREISALDIGGGSGHELSNLKKSDNRIIETTLLDMREQSREVVELGGHKFICKQIESIDNNFQDRYDFIMMLNLIEHLESPPKTLDKIYLMLNFGGILLVKTPNTNSLNRRIFQKKYWGGCHAPRHWVLFNEENFSSMAIKSGFQIVGFEYTQGSTQWAASLFGSVWIKFKSKKRILMADRLLFWPVCMIFAIFDFLTKKYFETDQMVFILKKQ